MLKVGITGGIGSGKSTVCRLFRLLGVPVYSADDRAKELVNTKSDLQKGIIELLGKEAFIGGTYNRPYVASKVFRDNRILRKLNALIHPAVADDFQKWIEETRETTYVIHEAAILFESGSNRAMDHVIFVDAPIKLRISRVMERDGMDENKVISRIKNQLPADKIAPMADWLINNDEKSLILPQILSIHNQLIKFS